MTSDRWHCAPLLEGEWWACEFPERPYDPSSTWFAAECRACTLALGAAAAHDRETVITWTTASLNLSLAEAYDACRAQHALPALPTVVP